MFHIQVCGLSTSDGVVLIHLFRFRNFTPVTDLLSFHQFSHVPIDFPRILDRKICRQTPSPWRRFWRRLPFDIAGREELLGSSKMANSWANESGDGPT